MCMSTYVCLDDGSAKRFKKMFSERGYEIIICGKVRDGLKRHIHIQVTYALDHGSSPCRYMHEYFVCAACSYYVKCVSICKACALRISMSPSISLTSIARTL